MDPKFPSQNPSPTPYLDQLLEQKRQKQLARAKEICEDHDLLGAKVALLQEELVDLRRKMKEQEEQALTLRQHQIKHVYHLQQCMAQLEDHLAGSRDLTMENEELKQQVLMMKQQIEQLQQEKQEDKDKILRLEEQLSKTQGLLETTQGRNQELQTQLKEMQSNEVQNTSHDKQWAKILELMREEEEVVAETSGPEAEVAFAQFEDIDLNALEEPRLRAELNWAEYLLVSDVLALYSDTGYQNDDSMESHLPQEEHTGQGWGFSFSDLPFISGSKSSKETTVLHM